MDLRYDTMEPNQLVTNSQYEQNVENPYYECDFDANLTGNDQSRKDGICADLNETENIKTTQNLYYEL